MTLTPERVRAVAFDRAPLGRRGYREDQVDAFLDRVEAALAGTDPLTADDVRTAVFDPASRVRRGYDEDQVDAFLDTVVAALSEREGRPVVGRPTTEPAGTAFLPLPPAPQGVRGYRHGDVARLAELLNAAVQDMGDAPTEEQLSKLRLTLTYFVGQGYDPRTVDALVDAWTLELRRRES
ncbi:DivIVA domain-containing protein [Actinokineospora sp. NPDC004072]